MGKVFVPWPHLDVQDTSLTICKDLINASNSVEDRLFCVPEHQYIPLV